MLQQTQVDRVVSYYRAFLKEFPTPRSLARSPLADVLRSWQGLGYNRRAKMLHDAAKVILSRHAGRVPRSYDELIELPGIGEYTAKAIRVFAFNDPEVLIETNVRTVFLHHFFPKKKKVEDAKLFPYMEIALDREHPRQWYSALMDYGTHLKKTLPNPSRRSAHHTKQKPFKGSDRQIRGAILRALSSRRQKITALPFPTDRLAVQIQKLLREGLIVRRGRRFFLPD